MAKRAQSTTEEVKPSHGSMVSHPNAVKELVETAAELRSDGLARKDADVMAAAT